MAPKKKGPIYSGGRKVRPGKAQAEALTGRDENVSHKRNFQQGPIARTDPNAGSTAAKRAAKFIGEQNPTER